jgi:hypothetical protein
VNAPQNKRGPGRPAGPRDAAGRPAGYALHWQGTNGPETFLSADPDDCLRLVAAWARRDVVPAGLVATKRTRAGWGPL